MQHTTLALAFMAFTFMCTGCFFPAPIPVDHGKLLEEESRLVVNSFISPQDTLVKVYVSHSQPVFGEPTGEYYTPLEFVPNAMVWLEGSSQAPVQLRYGVLDSLLDTDTVSNLTIKYPIWGYSISTQEFPILENETYHLLVETPEGEMATATCMVPPAAPGLALIGWPAVSALIQQNPQEPAKEFQWQQPLLAWESQGPQQGGYLLKAVVWRFASASQDWVPSFVYHEPLPLFDSSTGLTYQAPISFNQYGILLSPNNYATIYLHRLSPGLAEYVDAYDGTQLYTQNPILELRALYSNIEGGLGIFEAYTQNALTLYLPQ